MSLLHLLQTNQRSGKSETSHCTTVANARSTIFWPFLPLQGHCSRRTSRVGGLSLRFSFCILNVLAIFLSLPVDKANQRQRRMIISKLGLTSCRVYYKKPVVVPISLFFYDDLLAWWSWESRGSLCFLSFLFFPRGVGKHTWALFWAKDDCPGGPSSSCVPFSSSLILGPSYLCTD